MTNFPYNRNIPFATNNPSVDQPNMLTNTNSTDSLIAVDHISFKNNDGGFHKTIHQQPFSTTSTNPPKNNPPTLPPLSGSNGEIFTVQMNPVTGAGGNSDEVLFYQSGGGRYLQLTNVLVGAGNQALEANIGYTPLPGGIILQWGFVSPIPSGGAPITFATPFLNAIFNVQITGSSATSFMYVGSSLSKTGFTIKASGSSGSSATAYWTAIGN